MACNSQCKYFSYVTSVTLGTGALILNLSNTPATTSGNNFCFRFNPNIVIPTTASTLAVYVNVGGVNYPVWNKYGNVMIGSDLLPSSTGVTYCPRFTYHAYFGTQTVGTTATIHAIVHNIPRPSCTVYFN